MNFTTDHPNLQIFGTAAMISLVVCNFIVLLVLSSFDTVYKGIRAWVFVMVGWGGCLAKKYASPLYFWGKHVMSLKEEHKNTHEFERRTQI